MTDKISDVDQFATISDLELFLKTRREKRIKNEVDRINKCRFDSNCPPLDDMTIKFCIEMNMPYFYDDEDRDRIMTRVGSSVNNEISNRNDDMHNHLLITGIIYDTCSICLEETNTVTLCQHYICKDCFNQLQNSGFGDRCPQCRHKF